MARPRPRPGVLTPRAWGGGEFHRAGVKRREEGDEQCRGKKKKETYREEVSSGGLE